MNVTGRFSLMRPVPPAIFIMLEGYLDGYMGSLPTSGTSRAMQLQFDALNLVTRQSVMVSR